MLRCSRRSALLPPRSSFCEVFIQGVDTASAAMIGQNLGAKKQDRARKVVWRTLSTTLIFACFISILCAIWPEHIFGLFIGGGEAAVDEIRACGALYLRIMIVHFFSSSMA